MLVLGASTERANLLQRPQDDGHVGLCGQRALACAGQPDNGRRQLAERAQQADDLLAFAAVRQGQDDIVGMDHAQIAVDGAGGVQDVGTGARRVERAGDLLADVGRFAGAGDRDPAGAVPQQLHRLKERAVETIRHLVKGRRFRTDHLLGISQPVGRLRQRSFGMELEGHGKAVLGLAECVQAAQHGGEFRGVLGRADYNARTGKSNCTAARGLVSNIGKLPVLRELLSLYPYHYA